MFPKVIGKLRAISSARSAEQWSIRGQWAYGQTKKGRTPPHHPFRKRHLFLFPFQQIVSLSLAHCSAHLFPSPLQFWVNTNTLIQFILVQVHHTNTPRHIHSHISTPSSLRFSYLYNYPTPSLPPLTPITSSHQSSQLSPIPQLGVL